MLAKKNRLNKSSEYEYVFKKGKRYSTPYFIAVGAEKSDSLDPRFGIIASKKVGNAVERNRAKRRVREIVRELLPEIRENQAFIFICFDNIHTASYETLKEAIHKSLYRLGGVDKATSKG